MNAAASTSRITGTRIPMNKPREGPSKFGTGLSFDLLNYEKKKTREFQLNGYSDKGNKKS